MKLVTNRKLKKAIYRAVQIQILHARITHCRQFDRALLPNSNLTMSDITHIFTDEKTESQRNVSNRSISGTAGSQVHISSLYSSLPHV